MPQKRANDNDLVETKKFKPFKPFNMSSTHLRQESVKLAHLDDKMLMLILAQLNLDDLTNVALVSQRFNHLVYRFLGNECINRTVTIQSSGVGEWLWFQGTTGKFKFDNSWEVEKFFGTSGHLVSRLLIDCAPSCMKISYKLIETTVFGHCSDVLTKIEIATTFLPIMTEVTEPFPKITVLKLDSCELSANFCQRFNSLFPSLRRLLLKDCRAFDPQCIEAHFPYLEELILFGNRHNRMVFNKYNILRAIAINPQIQRLTVDFDLKNHPNLNDFELDFDFYHCVGGLLPQLKSLKVFGERKYEQVHYETEIEFDCIEEFTVANIYNQQPDEIAPFTFNCLRELNIEHLERLTTNWINFITMNEHVTKLTVDIYGSYSNDEGIELRERISKDHLQTIFKWLTHLKELHLHAETIEAKDIVAVLWKRKSLMKVVLREYFMVDSIVETFDALTAKKAWLVNYDTENLILNRTSLRT